MNIPRQDSRRDSIRTYKGLAEDVSRQLLRLRYLSHFWLASSFLGNVSLGFPNISPSRIISGGG